MATATRCALTNRMLNALFLQVAPGYDEETIEQIKRGFGRKTSVYVGFGRYDLLVIREDSGFDLLEKFHEVKLDHVQDWFPVWGLKWAVDGNSTKRFSSKKEVLGLSFIKLDLDHAFNSGINPVREEERIVQRILSEVPCMIYSSLGFNELLVVSQAKSFRDLANRVVSIKKSLIQDNIPVALDISTIPALKYSTVMKREVDGRIREKLNVYLLLSLRIGLSRSFRKRLKELVGTYGKSIYGFHDVLLELSGRADEVLHKIHNIRKEGKNHGLYSSFTMIPHIDEILSFSIPTAIPLTKNNNVSPHRETLDGNSIDEQIRFYMTWSKTSTRDVMTKHIFADHIDFFADSQKFRKVPLDVESFKAGENVISAQRLDSLRECIRVGFEQRASGLCPGNLLGPKSIRTEPLGGIQRVTMAIESLPLYLFNRLGYGWWSGFCIHGYIGRFYRTEGGILNVPQQYRIVPEMWWGIFHEIGHGAFAKVETALKFKITEELESLIDIVVRRHEPTTSIDQKILEEDYMRFIEEIFAELFGFHFGFNDDWELYFNRVWSYFAKEFTLDFRHLSRSVLAYYTFGPGKDLERDEITVDEIDNCIQQIENITKKENGRTIDEEDRDFTILVVWAFLGVADAIRTYFMEKPSTSEGSRVEEITNVLREGRVFYSDNPLEILFPLIISNDRLPCKHRFATILSLYSCYCKYLSEHLREGISNE